MPETELEDDLLDVCSLIGGEESYDGDMMTCRRRTEVTHEIAGEHMIVDDGEDAKWIWQPECHVMAEDGQVTAFCQGEHGYHEWDAGTIKDIDTYRWFGMEITEFPGVRTRTESRPGAGRGEKVVEYDF